MKKVLMIVGGGLAVLVLGFVGIVMMQPDDQHIERSVVIAASPADVFPFANDFDKWLLWNPWQDLDPNQKVTFSENKVGAGAWYTWEGDDKVGKGKMAIRESVEPSKIVEDLTFIEPFPSTALITFTFTPEGDKTKVVWAMDSEQNFGAKAFGLFMDMDAMLGADFDKGLTKLKPLAEAEAARRVEAERVAAEAAAAAAVAAPVEGAVADAAVEAPK